MKSGSKTFGDGEEAVSFLDIQEVDAEVIATPWSWPLPMAIASMPYCIDWQVMRIQVWNRFSSSHKEPLFNPNSKLLSMSKNEWEEITEEVFQELFKKSAVKRTKYSGLLRNIDFLKS